MAFCGLGSPGIVVFHKLQSDSLNEVGWYANVLLSRVTRFARNKNKQGPYNEAYICFFINPPIPFMSLLCTIVSIFPLWIRISRWHSMRHMFGFSLIQQFPCRVDPYQVNKIKNYIIFESQIYLIVHPVLSCSQSHLSKMQICHFDV